MNKNYFLNKNSLLDMQIDNFLYAVKNKAVEYRSILSIILVGSMSRGEGSYVVQNNQMIITSDIEFIVITNEVKGQDLVYTIFNDNIQKIKQEIFQNSSNLFHIDFSFMNIKKFKKLDNTLFVYEMKSFGITVYGLDLIHILPEVTIKNICRLDINDIVLHRLFSTIYYGINTSKISDEEFKYIICKNILDLLTIELVQKDMLIPGFSNRIEFLKTNKIDINYDNKKLYLDCYNVKKGIDSEPLILKYILFQFIEFIDRIGYFRKNLFADILLYNSNFYLRRYIGSIYRGFKYKKLFISNGIHRKNMINFIRYYLINDTIDIESYNNIIKTHQVLFNFPRFERRNI